MLKKIKNTIKHSAIYGIGSIATKLIGIVLLPLYTKHITVSEYGILGILEITIVILAQVLIFGQPNAYMRFHNLNEFREKRKSTLFTTFISLFSIAILLNIIGYFFANNFAAYFSNPTEFTIYFKLCFAVISLRIINRLFLADLRIKEKSIFYALANILKIVVILGLNIYFVAFAKIGIKGILFSYLIGDGILFLILFPKMISEMMPKFDSKILKSALRFGFPLIFASLAGMLLNMGDRYLLKILVNYEEVGLYNLGYKIAGILNVLLIQSFALGFLPIVYKIFQQKGDKRFYSKLQTYFVFILFWAGLGLAFFSKELIETFTLNPDYWLAYKIVPIIILAYIFGGAKYVVNLGLYLKNKTKYVAYNTVFVLILNVILNFLFIPKYKMMGAAVATLISFIVLYFITYFTANRFYKIPYENMKILKMLILAGVLFFLSTLTANLNILARILIKIAIIFSFPFILYFLNFYEKIELKRLKQSWQKWKSPQNWKKNISQIKFK
ncbi:MAG: polysaccharide biosynthesis C-terminal domain-containing protein [Candidatus Cloacimonetes bacterium]|nr:polysaccharide biosynthesis C-terminal domain-containing protein [Candidatus Cloacimonadota bacterium]